MTVGPGGLIEDLLADLQLHRNQIGKPLADRVNGGVQSVHRKCGQCLAIPIPEYLAQRPYFAVCPAYQRLDVGYQCSLPGIEVMLQVVVPDTLDACFGAVQVGETFLPGDVAVADLVGSVHNQNGVVIGDGFQRLQGYHALQVHAVQRVNRAAHSEDRSDTEDQEQRGTRAH